MGVRQGPSGLEGKEDQVVPESSARASIVESHTLEVKGNVISLVGFAHR